MSTACVLYSATDGLLVTFESVAWLVITGTKNALRSRVKPVIRYDTIESLTWTRKLSISFI